jgi:hypothetical protein
VTALRRPGAKNSGPTGPIWRDGWHLTRPHGPVGGGPLPLGPRHRRVHCGVDLAATSDGPSGLPLESRSLCLQGAAVLPTLCTIFRHAALRGRRERRISCSLVRPPSRRETLVAERRAGRAPGRDMAPRVGRPRAGYQRSRSDRHEGVSHATVGPSCYPLARRRRKAKLFLLDLEWDPTAAREPATASNGSACLADLRRDRLRLDREGSSDIFLLDLADAVALN